MIEETATVSRVEGNQVWVKTEKATSCGQCNQNSACSTNFLENYLHKRELSVDTDLCLQAGDRIVVAIDEGALVKGSLLIYIVPLLVLFAGAGLGELFAGALKSFNADVIISISAIFCFAAALAVFNRIQYALPALQFSRPVVLRKL